MKTYRKKEEKGKEVEDKEEWAKANKKTLVLLLNLPQGRQERFKETCTDKVMKVLRYCEVI